MVEHIEVFCSYVERNAFAQVKPSPQGKIDLVD
jgi:hypothetical protein